MEQYSVCHDLDIEHLLKFNILIRYCIDGCYFGLLWDKINVIENKDR